MKRILISLFVFSFLFLSCEHETPIEQGKGLGSANFQVYVAIGNSITAGYQSSALYASSQQYSYPNLIARQVRAAGGVLEFSQPLIKDPGVGGRLRISKVSPLTIVTDPSLNAVSTSIYDNPALPQFAYHNLAIPGAYVNNPFNNRNDVLDTLNSYSKSFGGSYDDNPFHHVVRRNPAIGQPGNTGSVWQQLKRLNPTFMSVWLGNNDVFVHAASGGILPYTSAAAFQAQFNAMIDSLLTTNAQIVIATIPDVTQAALMTTLRWFIPDPADISKPVFGAYISLYGEMADGTPKYLGPHDLVLLTAADWLADGYGIPSFFPGSRNLPLPRSVILDSAEVALVRSLISQYNTMIRQRESARVAIADVYSTFSRIASGGVFISGVQFTTAYMVGGIFSLDGIHPTSQASGLIANKFIEAINAKWGASIPHIDVLGLPGIPIPLGKGENRFGLMDVPFRKVDAAKQWYF